MALQDTRILVVDDDKNCQGILCTLLQQSGHKVAVASNGKEGLREFFLQPPDLALLDVCMPHMDGLTLLQRIREVSDLPVIMLTASGEEHHVVHGLRSGADDYLVKPFRREELLARIETVLRRSGTESESQDVYRDEFLHIDFQRRCVHVRSQQVQLSPLEFKLLNALVQKRGIVLSPERLLDLCWGDRYSGPESVRVYINYLRRKLEDDPANPSLVQTVRGFGYRYRS